MSCCRRAAWVHLESDSFRQHFFSCAPEQQQAALHASPVNAINTANRLGGRDNISAGLLEFTTGPQAREENGLPDAITLRPKKEDITVRREQR